MYCDQLNSPSDTIFKSDHTISFHVPKLAFFLESNQQYIDQFTTVNIGLLELYNSLTPSPYYYINNLEYNSIDLDSEPTSISYNEVSKLNNNILEALQQRAIHTRENIELKGTYNITATAQGKVFIEKPKIN